MLKKAIHVAVCFLPFFASIQRLLIKGIVGCDLLGAPWHQTWLWSWTTDPAGYKLNDALNTVRKYLTDRMGCIGPFDADLSAVIRQKKPCGVANVKHKNR